MEERKGERRKQVSNEHEWTYKKRCKNNNCEKKVFCRQTGSTNKLPHDGFSCEFIWYVVFCIRRISSLISRAPARERERKMAKSFLACGGSEFAGTGPIRWVALDCIVQRYSATLAFGPCLAMICFYLVFPALLLFWLAVSPNVESVSGMCPQVCPAQYDPVCGRNANNRYREFSNACILDIHNCENPRDGNIARDPPADTALISAFIVRSVSCGELNIVPKRLRSTCVSGAGRKLLRHQWLRERSCARSLRNRAIKMQIRRW